MAEDNNGPIMALVLIRIDPLVERTLLDELLGFEGVKEAHLIYGPYDVYCIVECPSYDALTSRVGTVTHIFLIFYQLFELNSTGI